MLSPKVFMGYCTLLRARAKKTITTMRCNKNCPGNEKNNNSNNNKRTVEQPTKINHTCNYDELVRTRTFMGVRPWEKLMGKHIRANT